MDTSYYNAAMKPVKRFPLRIPTDLHAKLVKLAKAEGRSLHAQFLYWARQAVAKGEKEAHDSARSEDESRSSKSGVT
jgi:hypothetical protein